MSGPVFACITPHPPIVVPAVGRGQERGAQATLDGFATLREQLAAAAADVLLLICPHGPIAEGTFQILDGPLFGDLGRFGAPACRFARESDTDLVAALLAEAQARELPLRPVSEWERDDHSAWVPLHFLQDAAPQATIVLLSISPLLPHNHYALGRAVAEVLEASPKRVAVIASADGSHVLNADGPYGFHPAGPRFEQEFQRAVEAWDINTMLAFPSSLRSEAAEDCVASVTFLMGALSRHATRPRILASESPWGVGYTTVAVAVGDPLPESKRYNAAASQAPGPEIVAIARAAVEAYTRDGERLQVDTTIDPRWTSERAASFVSIHSGDGALRGCIGTVTPSLAHVAAEVVSNAIAAATTDPRFLPVRPHELADLTYKVDLLTPPEQVAGETDLDVRRYGVIVEAQGRRGLLLPDLGGISSVAEQVRIAQQKAGIQESEATTLFRFEVERYEEEQGGPTPQRASEGSPG